MSTLSTLTTAKPVSGALGAVFGRLAKVWADRRAAAAFASMNERELQDVGWGQMDRYAHVLHMPETPPERRARAAAVAAWHRPMRKAA